MQELEQAMRTTAQGKTCQQETVLLIDTESSTCVKRIIDKLDLDKIGDLGIWGEIESIAKHHVIPLDGAVENAAGKAFLDDAVEVPSALAAIPVCTCVRGSPDVCRM